MKFLRFPLAMLLLGASIVACENNKEISTPVDETIENVSFSEKVVPILNTNCVGCHGDLSASAGYNLEGYDNVKKHIDKPAFLGAIKHESGYSPMPKGGPRMSDNKIKTIEVWIQEGARNN